MTNSLFGTLESPFMYTYAVTSKVTSASNSTSFLFLDLSAGFVDVLLLTRSSTSTFKSKAIILIRDNLLFLSFVIVNILFNF